MINASIFLFIANKANYKIVIKKPRSKLIKIKRGRKQKTPNEGKAFFILGGFIFYL